MPPAARFGRPLSLALLLAVVAPGPARAQPPSPVLDGAGMFSTDTLREAKAEMARIERAFNLAVTVETVETLRGQASEEFAIRRAEQVDRKGVFVLIARKEHKVETLASPRALREALGPGRLTGISDAFREQFRKDQVDAGLIKGVQAIASALAAVRPPGGEPSTRPPGGGAPAPTAIEGGSSAGSSSLVLRQQVRLTLAGARKAVAGAEAKASAMGHKMNIAVVDDGGHLLAFARMDGARPASVATATTKAVTAATYRQPTGPVPGKPGAEPDPLLNLSLQNAAQASGGKITTLLGGVPIVVDGQVIGAVGVGGGSGEQDAEVARAGVETFLAGLKDGLKDGWAEDPKPRRNDADEEINRPLRGESPAPRPSGADTPPR